MLDLSPLSEDGELVEGDGFVALAAVPELAEDESVVVGAAELGFEGRDERLERLVLSGECNGGPEGLFGGGAVAGGGGGGFGSAEMHLGDEAGGSAAGEVGGVGLGGL